MIGPAGGGTRWWPPELTSQPIGRPMVRVIIKLLRADQLTSWQVLNRDRH